MNTLGSTGALLDRVPDRPTAAEAMSAALGELQQHVGAVMLDLLWKSLWLICVVVSVWLMTGLLLGLIGSISFEGPDLGQIPPILLLGIAAQLWQTYGAIVVGAVTAFIVGCAVFWLILEALFRGGIKGFWIYIATGAARTATLLAAAGVLGAMVLEERDAGTALISAIVFLALWFMVITAENLIRRDGVQLLGTDLGSVMMSSAAFFTIELAGVVLFWGTAAAALLLVSNPAQLLYAGLVTLAVFVLWTVFHSLLMAVRFSTIDYMRRSLGDE